MSEHSQTTSARSSGTERNPVNAARFDYARYRHHLDRLDMPEASRRRLGEALHAFARNLVDRAWGDDPVQLARRAGDRFRKAAEGDSSLTLGSRDPQTIEQEPISVGSVQGDAIRE